jgi:hypothetical protein
LTDLSCGEFGADAKLIDAVVSCDLGESRDEERVANEPRVPLRLIEVHANVSAPIRRIVAQIDMWFQHNLRQMKESLFASTNVDRGPGQTNKHKTKSTRTFNPWRFACLMA